MFPEAKILAGDLTNSKIVVKPLPGDVYRLYPGGSALGLYLILQEMPANVDSLSPDNMLVFSVSPLTGLPISGLSRIVTTTKSPLTGTIGDSQAGGFLPAYLKANGWDAVVFRGKAEKPMYLYINGETVTLKSAEHLWGKVTGEVEQLIKNELDDEDLEIAQIGPAGENLVKFACIINHCNRANGRNGTGAVMGSKNLKALVVKKVEPFKPACEKVFSVLVENGLERLKDNPVIAGLGRHGTIGVLDSFNELGFLPTKNWTSGCFPEGADNITGTTMSNSILVDRAACHACAITCKRVVEVPGKVDPLYGGPEYETAAALGSYCGVTNLETIVLANQLCNMYGIDTISCGGTIAFAMECYEKGLIGKDTTGGLELNFGNQEVLLRLIEMIAKREGFGDMLAEGSSRAARKIGGEALELTMSVKGKELPAHMPQLKPSVGLIYAVNPFGVDHQSSEHDFASSQGTESKESRWLAQLGIWKGYKNDSELDDDKVRFAFDSQCYYSILDTLGLCQFVWGLSWQVYGPSDLIDLCRLGIDWETSLFELMRVGERRINMMRYFNAREGFTKADDTLPERIFKPLPDGPSKGLHVNKDAFLKALETYYQFAGWEVQTGNPSEATLKKLSLGWLL